jgi:site-specific DNA recombinase
MELTSDDTALLEQIHASRGRGRGMPPKWLLSGIPACGVCGGYVKRRKIKSGDGYSCVVKEDGKWRVHVTRKVEIVDERVKEFLFDYVMTHELPNSAAVLPPLLAEVRELRGRVDECARLVAAGKLTPASLARVEADILPTITALEDRILRVRCQESLSELAEADDPRAVWGAMPFERQREILRQCLDITLFPVGRIGKGEPDPSSIRVEWFVF